MSNRFILYLAILFAMLPSAGSYAATTKELLEAAPVFQLLLDNSGSSPATDETFVSNAWPIIEEKLLSMPMGSVVIVNSVGNASIAPMARRVRIQKIVTSEGAPIEDIARGLKTLVLGFPKQVRGQEHGQSHLVGGLFDASKNINTKAAKPNVIVMLSDLIEFSPIANCYKNSACPLPTPTFKLDNTDVLVLGVGRGLPSNHEMAIFSAWEKFLGRVGAVYTLKKTF